MCEVLPKNLDPVLINNVTIWSVDQPIFCETEDLAIGIVSELNVLLVFFLENNVLIQFLTNATVDEQAESLIHGGILILWGCT